MYLRVLITEYSSGRKMTFLKCVLIWKVLNMRADEAKAMLMETCIALNTCVRKQKSIRWINVKFKYWERIN